MNKLLPIGSVIRVINDYEKYIIIGHLKNSEYDYVCVLYPYGYIDIKDCYYFKKEDIDLIFLLGDINY